MSIAIYHPRKPSQPAITFDEEYYPNISSETLRSQIQFFGVQVSPHFANENNLNDRSVVPFPYFSSTTKDRLLFQKAFIECYFNNTLKPQGYRLQIRNNI